VTRADSLIGALLLLGCLLMLWLATRLQYGTEFAPGPGFAPVWLALIGAILSFLLAVTAWRVRRLPAEQPETGGVAGLARVGASLIGLAVIIQLIPPLGLLLALLVYLIFLSLAVERLGLVTSLGVSIGTVGFIYLVFARFLGVPFPMGPLGF
jgi:hypothetical protein